MPFVIVPAAERNRMKNFLKTIAMATAASFLLAGCLSTPPAPEAETGHPANPRAATSPVPPLNVGLFSPADATNAAPSKTAAPHAHRHE